MAANARHEQGAARHGTMPTLADVPNRSSLLLCRCAQCSMRADMLVAPACMIRPAGARTNCYNPPVFTRCLRQEGRRPQGYCRIPICCRRRGRQLPDRLGGILQAGGQRGNPQGQVEGALREVRCRPQRLSRCCRVSSLRPRRAAAGSRILEENAGSSSQHQSCEQLQQAVGGGHDGNHSGHSGAEASFRSAPEIFFEAAPFRGGW